MYLINAFLAYVELRDKRQPSKAKALKIQTFEI
jgi:hypothetical protein